MNVIANTFRGFLNITASGVLLLIAVVISITTANFHYGNPSQDDGIVTSLAVWIGFIGLTGYMSLKFWRHRPAAGSSTASALLCGSACLLFMSSMAYYCVRR
jgi:hypothetical protein